MSAIKVFVVEDEKEILSSIANLLSAEAGFEVRVAIDGLQAIEILAVTTFDLLILDCNLPGCTGLDICKSLRERDEQVPILMLTGRAELQDKERGFLSGVDDYLTKPFHPTELLLRVKALLRRQRTALGDTLTFRDLELKTKTKTLTRNGASIRVPPRELEVLEYLMRRRDRYVSVDELLTAIWPSSADCTEQTVRISLLRLRKLIDLPGKSKYIISRYGCGYRLNLIDKEK